jgi:tetratricopeptide (TPR) repeat protein
LCQLANFDLPVKATYLEYLKGSGQGDTISVLNTLVNRSLVRVDQSGTTFILMPLVVEFLRHKNIKTINLQGKKIENLAYDLVNKNGGRQDDRFPVLEDAWPVISASLPRLVVSSNSRLQRVCDALRHFLNFSGRLDEKLALATEAEILALSEKDFLSAGHRAYDVGWVHYLRGQSDEVLADARRAEAYWQDGKYGNRERGVALHLRGLGFEIGDNFEAAAKMYAICVDLDQTTNPESEDVCIDLNDLAEAERRGGDYNSAEVHYVEALRIARKVNYREGIAYITGNLGDLAFDRSAWVEAERLGLKALDLSEELGRKELIAHDCWLLARAFVRQGRIPEALPYIKRAVSIYRDIGSPDFEGAVNTLDECLA